jgi:Subtilisin-like serine proteases
LQRRILAVIGAIALMLPSTAALAATGEESSSPKSSSAGTRGEISEGITPRSVDADGRVTVIIEMKGDPVAVVQAEKGRKLTASERSAVKGKLKKAQDSIRGSITGKGGKIQAQMQSAYNGIQAVVPATQLDAVADLPGVVAVHPVRTYELDNAVSVPFLGVPQVWEDTGYTGANVKVAILDTGVDYTHAAFGGPGTVEAFQAAAATSDEPADPALFGPAAPRVKGGIDLVGDDYNADPASETYQPVPHPDPNPLDCNGHGSHVAGTAAGSGVNDDGSTYTGPYDSTTASQTFRVGPGVAPEADIYAVRVFGCDGSTDVVVPAIDWAVANGMDVINMSLGSSFGRGDDPDAVAASNAVGAGVVVVASAGNSGPSPYLTGSPARATASSRCRLSTAPRPSPARRSRSTEPTSRPSTPTAPRSKGSARSRSCASPTTPPRLTSTRRSAARRPPSLRPESFPAAASSPSSNAAPAPASPRRSSVSRPVRRRS